LLDGIRGQPTPSGRRFRRHGPSLAVVRGRDAQAFVAMHKPGTATPVLFAGGSAADGTGALFKSDDEGHSWSSVAFRFSDGSTTTSKSPQWAGAVLAGPAVSELYVTVLRSTPPRIGNFSFDLVKSSDGGDTWSFVLEDTPVCVIYPDSTSHALYGIDIGYDSAEITRIYRSRDGGASWEKTSYPGNVAYNVRVYDGVVYSMAGNIFASADQGTTWTSVGDLRAPITGGIRPLATDLVIRHQDDGNAAYIVTTTEGLYKSVDAGRTWSPIGLQGFALETLDVVNTSTADSLQLVVGYSRASAEVGHAGIVMLVGDSVVPLSNGLPDVSDTFQPKAGRYALSAGAIHVCTNLTACSGGELPQIGTLVEFHNDGLNHFFMTFEGAEADGIDRGAAGPGWSRTGHVFRAYVRLRAVPRAVGPVCRFYGTPGIGPNSHFFTADRDECAAVSSDPGWSLETSQSFAAETPMRQCLTIDGEPECSSVCGRGRLVYRLYNNGYLHDDSNHRYVTDFDLYQSMQTEGWAGEGAQMCTAQ